MNLYDIAKADNKKILNDGFVVDCILTNGKKGSEYKEQKDIKCHYIDITLDINLETGLPFVGKKVSVSFHIDDITIGSGINENYEGWTFEFTNNIGQTFKYKLINPMPDRGLGMLTGKGRIQE